jgi:hypothetical protein
MKKWITIAIMAIIIMGFRVIGKKTKDPSTMGQSIQQSLNLLQYSSHEFMQNAKCFSCHGQCLSTVVFTMAKHKGFSIADSSFEETRGRILDVLNGRKTTLMENNEMQGANVGIGYGLWALASSNTSPSKSTTVVVKRLLDQQTREGFWVAGNGRAPLEYYSFTTTALALNSIQYFAPAGMGIRVDAAVQRGRRWLTETAAVNNEEKVSQLLGLAWTKADPEQLKKLGTVLLSRQHVNGGWSQLDSLPADAYATGQCLYALHEAGILKPSDTAFIQGINFLLRTQAKDGSWRIKSRSHPSVPYVYSGFPYGDDQFISAAGTNWATMALLLATN